MPSDIHSLSGAIPEWWRPLLQGWGELMDDYCEFWPTDAPYWHGERALTGFLVAAAWRLRDGWGLAEFSARRRRGGKRRGGAGDAWVGQGKTSWSAVEAKCPQLYSTHLERTIHRTQLALEEAAADLRSLEKEDERGRHPVGICYVVPCLREKGPYAKPERVSLLFDGLVEKFHSEWSIIAIYRPPGNEPRRGRGRGI